MSKVACDHCGKTADEPTHASARGNRWCGMPSGWLRWDDWCFGELMQSHLVCSASCAEALEAKEEADKAAARAEYLRRKEAGQLTDMEKFGEWIADEYNRELSRTLVAMDDMTNMRRT